MTRTKITTQTITTKTKFLTSGQKFLHFSKVISIPLSLLLPDWYDITTEKYCTEWQVVSAEKLEKSTKKKLGTQFTH